MSVGSFTIGVSELLLGLCLLVLVLLIRFRGFGPAVLVAAVVSITGTVAFLATFGIPVAA